MLNNLKDLLDKKCSNWDLWIETFDKFVEGMPRDPDNKMFLYKDVPDYCTWEQDDNNLYVFSYRYVNHIDQAGNMHCLQDFTEEKFEAILNYQKLYSFKNNKSLPILIEFKKVEGYLYTHFVNSYNDLGYPSPYSLFTIMMTSNDVLNDFEFYIKQVVDNYVEVIKSCLELNLPFFTPRHLLINHLSNGDMFYFKDTMFFYISKDKDINDIGNAWYGTIDGFRRAQGIIDAYSTRPGSDREITKQLFQKIEDLKNYARTKCLNLSKQNQL